MLLNLLTNLSFYIPEVISILTMCSLLFLEATYSEVERGRRFVYVAATIGLTATIVTLFGNLEIKSINIFADAVTIDSFSTFIKIIMTLGTLGVIYLCHVSKDIYYNMKSEFLILAVGVLIGGMLLASANNMLTIYLGVETLSILSYVMTSLKKKDSNSQEAGMKYALYGGISAGIMLFGISHMYGILGTIQFTEMVAVLPTISEQHQLFLMISFILFFVGIGYKIACFPFHMWSPDVYQGAPIPVTAFFSIVPKMAGLAVIARVTMLFFAKESALQDVWIGLLHVIAAMTMTVGNITAIKQDSVKRLLAFSSIGHVGMMLLGIVVLEEIGLQSILFYGFTYLFMTLVAFYITAMVSDEVGTDFQYGFKGLIRKHPFMAVAMSITLFSLAGMPPLSGFVAKFNMISVVVDKGYIGLALIAAVNSVISLYYYLRLVKLMTIDQPELEENISGFGFLNQLVIVGLSLPVILLGIFFEKLMVMARATSIFIN